MKILYVYNHMPKVYQHYLVGLLNVIKEKLKVKTLVYEVSDASDYNVKSFGFKDRFIRLCYKLKLVKSSSLDLQFFQQYQIIHLQHSYLWQKLLPLKKLKKRPKLVVTLRGADTYLKPWSYRTLANFYKSSNSLIDAYIVMSQNQKEYLQRWGISKESIHVIPISFGHVSKKEPKYPSKNVLKLVSAFRMTWEKNITGHLLFAKYLKDNKIDFTYDFYGNGEDLDHLYFLIDKYNLQDVVFVKGKVENADLRTALPSYDFFVQLSITESLGMSVIEAQASGLPCVVSNSGGLPEVVIKDKTALVGDFNNIKALAEACIALWKNNTKYYDFSKHAIAFVNDKFTVEKELEKLESLYANLIE